MQLCLQILGLLFFSEHDIHVAVSVYSYKDTEHDKVTNSSRLAFKKK